MKQYSAPVLRCFRIQNRDSIIASIPFVSQSSADSNSPSLAPRRDDDWNRWESGN